MHPTTKHCRDFLLAVLEICHIAVFSSEIADEWKTHQSGFARQWRLSMFARKKIVRTDNAANEDLRKQVEEAAANAGQRDAMLKDVHLVEAALAEGMRVAALDETVRAYFCSICGSVVPLRRVCWVNPDKSDDHPLKWLQRGAPADDFRMLGYDATEDLGP